MKKQFRFIIKGILFLVIGAAVWKWRSNAVSKQMRFEELSQNDVYEKLARGTGGQVWNLDKSPEQIEKIGDLVSQSRTENEKYVFLLIAEGRISEGAADFGFQVDSSLQSLVVFVSGLKSRPELEVFNPEDQKQEPSRVLESKQGATYLFSTPKSGQWRLKIRSADNVYIQVKGESDIGVLNARPVRIEGRPGHQGYFPYKGALKSGDKEIFSAEISEQLQAKKPKIQISLISRDGRTLSRDEIDSNVRIPSEPFRVLIDWENPDGGKGQRMENKIFQLGQLELVNFEVLMKESPDSERCRILQSSTHWSLLTDSKTGASASISCQINATATEKVQSMKLFLFVPWNAAEQKTAVQLNSADYQKLSKADCDQAEKMFSTTPQVLTDSAGRQARYRFACQGGPSEYQGVLDVQVSSPFREFD